MSELTLSPAVISIENVEALRTYEPVGRHQVVQVLCHTYRFHGGGRFMATDDTCSSDDNGLVIVSRKGCRWKRLLEDSRQGNILDWGADPSGREDSAAAFMAAVADRRIRMVVIPCGGRYQIGRSVNLEGRVSLMGGRHDHFGRRATYSRVEACSSLGGPMFINVGSRIQGIAFDGHGQKCAGLHLFSSVEVIKDCTFDYFSEAVVMFGVESVSLVDNTFTRTGKAIQFMGPVPCITSRFIRNHFYHVHDCITVEGQIHGSGFVDNIFQRVSGKAIHGQEVCGCHFQGNWWEHRNGAHEGVSISADHYRKLSSNTACANYCVDGWATIFLDGKYDNRVGGVMTGAGQVIVAMPDG